MKATTLKRTAIAAGVIAAVGFIATTAQSPTQTDEGDAELLYPKLSSRVNDLTRVEIERADGTVTLVREGDGWGVAERGGYPAKMDALRRVLIALSEGELLDAKTSNPALYERLGVQDVAEGTSNRVLRAYDAKDRARVDLIIGDRRQGGGPASYYVRRSGEEQSWLVEGDLSLPADARNWLVPTLAEIPRTRVQAVRLEHADGETVTLSRESADVRDFTLAEIPEGKVAKAGHTMNPIAEVVRALNLHDVRPAGEVAPPETPDVRATYWTFDGLRIDLTLWTVKPGDDEEGEEEHFLTIAAGEELSPFGVSRAPDDEGVADADQADGDADGANEGDETADVAAEVARITSRANGWTYVVSRHTTTGLTKRIDDLVKDAPAEEPALESPPEPTAEAAAQAETETAPEVEATDGAAASTAEAEPISVLDFENGDAGDATVTTPAAGAEAPATDDESEAEPDGEPISEMDFEDGEQPEAP